KALALTLCGKWQPRAYVESIGQGPEQQLGQTKEVALNGGTHYSAVIPVPAGPAPQRPAPGPAGGLSGVYKLGTVLPHRSPRGKISDVAAFVEGPMLRIG